MNRQELEQRLETVLNTIQTSEMELKRLREEKKKRILLLHPTDLKNMTARTRELEDQIEDSKLARGALEKQIQEFKEKKEPEAARILKRLAEELWPTAAAEYEKLKRIHGELLPVLGKITALNDEMMVLRNQHDRLVGDSIYTPQIVVPPELYPAANVKLTYVPPKSLDVRLASERERDRIASQLKEQRPVVSKILKRVGATWPLCPTCGGELLAWKYEVAKDESWGYAQFKCPKHPEQWRDLTYPTREPLRNEQHPLQGPIASTIESLPPNLVQSHGLATPGLTTQHKGGEKT